MSWLTPLRMERVHGSRHRHLLEDLSFRSKHLGRDVTAPAGFVYNGPSFPVIWGGDGEASSCIHDWMYSQPEFYTRAQADAVLRECLEAEGMGTFRRNWWWLGVRAVGWRYFGDARPRSAHDNPLDHTPGG